MYRYILVRPQRVTWKVVRSEEVEEEVQSVVPDDEGGVSTSTTVTTKHFTQGLDLGNRPLPETLPPPTPAPKVIVTADLPLTSNMYVFPAFCFPVLAFHPPRRDHLFSLSLP